MPVNMFAAGIGPEPNNNLKDSDTPVRRGSTHKRRSEVSEDELRVSMCGSVARSIRDTVFPSPGLVESGRSLNLQDQNDNDTILSGPAELPAQVIEDLMSKLSLRNRIHAIFDPQGLSEQFFAERHRMLSLAVFSTTFMLILLSVTIFTLESMPQFYEKDIPAFFVLETLCIAWFTCELSARFITSSNKKQFCKDPLNYIDLASILPYYIDIIVRQTTGKSGASGGFLILRVVRLTRMFRVFKLSKYNEGIQIVGLALYNSTDALSLLFFLTTITVVLFGSGIYYAEQGAAEWNVENETWVRKPEFGGPLTPHPFQSIPHSFWWCLVTLTTVGYGDMVPVTFPGYCVGSVTMLAGTLIVAFPIIILSSNFSEAREAFVRKKQIQMFRKALIAQGCSSSVAHNESEDMSSEQQPEAYTAAAEPVSSASEASPSREASMLTTSAAGLSRCGRSFLNPLDAPRRAAVGAHPPAPTSFPLVGGDESSASPGAELTLIADIMMRLDGIEISISELKEVATAHQQGRKRPVKKQPQKQDREEDNVDS
ncbi:Kcna5-prov protein [Diplonema papillatum]|nr:Kcna5-prov protein [Diplonema papillatum]